MKLSKNLNLGRSKIWGIITKNIGDTRKKQLFDKLKRTQLTVLLDESTDITTVHYSSKCMFRRYFNPSGKSVSKVGSSACKVH